MSKPKFKENDIVRYSGGPTALMKLESVQMNHGIKGNHYWYGRQFYGDLMGCYESTMTPATKEEIIKFKTDNHIGRLRDRPSLAE